MPEPSASPQPKRPRRFWLFAPYVALLIAVLAWSAFWWAESGRLQRKVVDEAKALQTQGDVAQWSSIKVDGYPFRLRLVLIGPKLADSAGWGLSATRLEATALAYAPDR